MRSPIADEDEARAALTAISGIGPWTADVYLMFCLGRADVFAAGDLALQVAAQLAMGLDERPSADDARRDCRALAALAHRRRGPALALLRGDQVGEQRSARLMAQLFPRLTTTVTVASRGASATAPVGRFGVRVTLAKALPRLRAMPSRARSVSLTK